MYIDKISFKSADAVINKIKYIIVKSLNHVNIDSKNHPYLVFNNVDGYIKDSNGDKYLVSASTDKNQEVFKKYTELWDEIKNEIETITGGKPIRYKKGFMKIRFESDDNLSLGKILSIPSIIIVIRSVFQDSKYYPQFYLHKCVYESVGEL